MPRHIKYSGGIVAALASPGDCSEIAPHEMQISTPEEADDSTSVARSAAMLFSAVAALAYSAAPSVTAVGALVSPRWRTPHAVSAVAAPPPSAPFEEWAEGNLINAPKIAITDVEELRGVIAIEPIAAGEELCVVPRTSCLDLAAVEGGQSPCADLVPTPLWTRLRWFERLACWLLAERARGAASPVSGYIGYLPRPETFADSPLEWSAEEIAELRCRSPPSFPTSFPSVKLPAFFA